MKPPPAQEYSEPPLPDFQLELRKRREIEHALQESTQRYEHLISTIPCALYDYVLWPDGRSRFLYMSPHCKNIFEHEAEQIMEDATLLWSMVHPEDIERLKDADRMANQNGESFQSEVRIVLP